MKNIVRKLCFILIVLISSSFTTFNYLVNSLENKVAYTNWQTMFEDNFNDKGSLHKWEKAERPDFNSNNCIYKANNPKIGTIDDYSCLVLSASKKGNEYESGHVKSFFVFKPEKNEEYRVESKIKLVGFKGNEQKVFSQTYGIQGKLTLTEEKSWPTKGEINILDAYSYGNSSKYFNNLFYGSVIGEDVLANAAKKQFDHTDGWHNYALIWINDNGKHTLKIEIDEILVATYTNNDYKDLKLENFGKHNIIFNLNVGSNDTTFKNQSIKLFNKTEMYIDWIKVEKRRFNKHSFASN